MNASSVINNWQDFRPSRQHFQNKVMLVTGAANGIGRAVTRALAEVGTTVLMLDKKARHLEKLYDEITEQSWREPVILPVDLSDLTPETVTGLAQSVANEFSQLDALLHIAGELGSPSPMDQYDIGYWNEVMQVNLHAPYLLSRAFLPLLKQKGISHIVFTSAELGRTPKAFGGAYSIAYAGLEAQMQIWAQELKTVSNIKINSLDPGAVRTVMRRRSHPGENQDRLPTPQHIALAYLCLLQNSAPPNGEQLILGTD